jgi:uncharacterized protein
MKAKIIFVMLSLFLCHFSTSIASTPQKKNNGKATSQRASGTAKPAIKAAGCCDAKTIRAMTTACRDTKQCYRDATLSGCVEALKSLLDKGVQVERTDLLIASTLAAGLDQREWSPKGVQCRLETVRILMEKGAEVNARGEYGGTALMTAALWGRSEVVAFLLDNGAEINARDKEGKTALMEAVESNMDGAAKTVQTLLDKGAEVDAKDQQGSTALMQATGSGKQEKVKMLLAKGADINAKDQRGWTPLMTAISQKMPGTKTITLAFIQWLITNNADINAKNKDGETVLKFAKKQAEYFQDQTVVALLKKAGAKE